MIDEKDVGAFLTQAHLEELTGKKRRTEQIEVLNFMGFKYLTRPDGSLIVSWAHIFKGLGGIAPTVANLEPEPNWDALKPAAARRPAPKQPMQQPEEKRVRMDDYDNLITRLAEELAERIRPQLPLEIALWDTHTIALYLKRNEPVVRTRIACLPDFPKAIRPPSTRSVRGQPLYEAREVIAWAKKYKDKN